MKLFKLIPWSVLKRVPAEWACWADLVVMKIHGKVPESGWRERATRCRNEPEGCYCGRFPPKEAGP
jgi:hypothetical protein